MEKLTNSSRFNCDYVSDILDEIALEGLDGITTEALWMRLSVRQNFSFCIDEYSKNFLWKIVVGLRDVSFYEIPEARPSLKYYDYTVATDSHDATLELDEVYPYYKLKTSLSVFGSCQYYATRIDVSERVIKMTLKEVDEKWGNKLVIVASQDVRTFALIGNLNTPNLNFSKAPVHYDILERIGRSRHLGLATCGKGSIQSVVEDSKSVFHYLKFLHHHKLVKKQSLLGSLHANPNASKIHLTRFFEECLNDNMAILQLAIEELKTRPNYAMPCDEFNAMFDFRKKRRLKKFRKSAVFKKYITITKNLPYRTFFPDANQSEWERKSKGGERIVRCVQLVTPDAEISDLLEKDCEEEDDEFSLVGILSKGIYFEKIPIIAQAFYHIKKSGTLGLSQVELAHKMGLTKKFTRALVKRLANEKYCTFYIENDGRKRSKRYIVGENTLTKAAASEIVQILSESKSAPICDKNINGANSEEKVIEQKQTSFSELNNISQLQEENVSYRTLRRIGMIIKLIKQHRFRLFHQIAKFVSDEEMKEGVTSKVDRVTISRILQKLEKDELIKIINLTGKDKTCNTIKIYTDPSFELDEKQMETMYHAHSSYSLIETKVSDENLMALENEFSIVLLENLAEMKKMLEGIEQKKDKPSQDNVRECELIYSPKFIRLNILHDLVFHLVYDYTGIVDKTQEELIEELGKTTAIDDDLKKELPQLYGTQSSTYLFVPPLNNSGKTPGWFLLSDIFIRMPLSVIVKIVKVTESCSELGKYLHHPVKKHMLVKDLPLSIRQIFFNRKYQMGSLYNEFKRLCFMGLLQFGAKFGREHYQTFAYLNRKASLLDTSTSPAEYYQVPANMLFEVKSYYFESKSDVKKYWMDMYNICMGTSLGVKTNMIGKEILSERESGKESLKKVTEPKTLMKAIEDDNGTLPGDNLGAAGLDSVMFSFLRSNWTVPVNKSKEVRRKNIVKVPFQKIKKEQIKNRILLKRVWRKRGLIKSEKFTHCVSEEKPKMSKLRKVKERECRFKRRRKTSYDEIDLEALKLMNTLRVTWSTAEDNFLLICRVAMMYLCPNSRTFVRIPWSEVRRVLQANIPESRNKTQKAIARRIIYMLKSPTTVRSVNLCLEELKQMPEASAEFNCSELLSRIKPSTPNLTELQNQLYEKFYKLVIFLKDRFIDSIKLNVKKKDRDLIPDCLNEFLEKFQLETVPKHSITIKNIRENVIRATIMSSLSCRADKTSSAVQLFEIYRQYNDDELQGAIKNLHIDKVITVSKKAGFFKSGQFLPISFTPYKLSFAFQHMLNMKYAHTVYSESYVQLNNLLEKDEEFDVDLNDSNFALFLLASKELISFRTIIPEHIIVLDSGHLPDATYSKMLDRYCEMLRFSASNSKVVCTSGKILSRSENGETVEINAAKKRQLSDDESGVSHDEVKDKKRKLEEDDGVIKMEKKSNEAEPKDESNEVKENKDQDAVQCRSDLDQLHQDRTTRSSRVILYMMREEAKKDANSDSGKFSQELCVVNASKVFSKINKSRLEKYNEEMGPKVASLITKDIISKSLIPINLVDEDLVISKYKEDCDAGILKNILTFISSKKELGATAADLNLNCNCNSLGKIIEYLVKNKVVIKSGTFETRYISQKYCSPWLLNSFKMTRLEREKVKPNEVTAISLIPSSSTESDMSEVPKKKIKGVISMDAVKSEDYVPPTCSTQVSNKLKVVIRPWIRIDGSLNRKVLDRLLGSILGYVMTNPGITMRAIMNRFSPSLTPVWTMDLIEILFEIGCVTFTSMNVLEKSNLFSKSVVQVSETYTGLEDDNFVAVEAKVDAVIMLGLFIGNKTYSKDFLVD